MHFGNGWLFQEHGMLGGWQRAGIHFVIVLVERRWVRLLALC